MSRLPCFRISAAVVISLITAVACQTTPSEVEPAPMAEEGQKKLRSAMIGRWRKTEGLRAAQAGGVDGEERGPIAIWTFDEDGTGAKTTKPSPEAEGTEEPFDWHLEGRNLVVDYRNSSTTNYFRAETWSPAQMQWYRYTTDERYTFKKYGGADRTPDRPATGTSTPD